MNLKAVNEALHFKKRLYQRFDIIINRHEYKELCDAAEDSKMIHKISESRDKRLIKIRDQDIICVYDKIRKRLVTCLYADKE